MRRSTQDRSKQVQCEGMPNGRRCLYEAGHKGQCNDVRQSPPPRHFVQEPKVRTHFAF